MVCVPIWVQGYKCATATHPTNVNSQNKYIFLQVPVIFIKGTDQLD
jgi:hypothetical protein